MAMAARTLSSVATHAASRLRRAAKVRRATPGTAAAPKAPRASDGRAALERRIAKLEQALRTAREQAPRDESPRLRKLERAVEKARREAWKDESPHLVDLDYPSARIVLDASTKLARKRRNATSKEPRTVEWIEAMDAGEVLYDVGANVGSYSLIGAMRPQGALRVLAFEPAFATYALLCRNVIHNGVGAQVTPFPITLGQTTRLGSFGYADVAAGAGLHAGLDGAASAYDQPVLVFALDDLISRFDLEPPNHVKLDVDGAEVEVLRGAVRTLADARTRSVLVELGVRYEDDVDAFMAEVGLTRTDTLRGGEAAGERFVYALYRRPSP